METKIALLLKRIKNENELENLLYLKRNFEKFLRESESIHFYMTLIFIERGEENKPLAGALFYRVFNKSENYEPRHVICILVERVILNHHLITFLRN